MAKFLAVITALLLAVAAILFTVSAMAGETNGQRQDRITLQQQQMDRLHKDLSDINSSIQNLDDTARRNHAADELIRKSEQYRYRLELLEQEDDEDGWGY